MPSFEIEGIVPVVPTPFTNEDNPDLGALARLLEFAIGGHVCAVCLPAYASEFYKLTERERRDLVYRAIEVLDSRLPLVAQVNHPSAAVVAETAHEFERAGAAAVSVAVPRLFALPERDLLRYFDRILTAIGIPLVIQDFNPGGATVGVDFVQSLHRQHPHFRYLKLEEPLMAAKVWSIVDSTGGEVGVIDGWGGTYILELMDAGICGVMPGLAVADLLQIVWERGRAGDKDGAYELFQQLLPQITYSLQSLEFYHHAEKALLVARGVIPNAAVRDATLTVSDLDRAHLGFLNGRIVRLADSQACRTAAEAASSSDRAVRNGPPLPLPEVQR